MLALFDLVVILNVQLNSFWVCEKSDGVRVLVLILATTEAQEVYLVRMLFVLNDMLLTLECRNRSTGKTNSTRIGASLFLNPIMSMKSFTILCWTQNWSLMWTENLERYAGCHAAPVRSNVRRGIQHILRLHAFDLLVFCGQNLMRAKPLTSRYGVS